ncbi:MAG: ribose-phosphate diphosphokinase [Candidatus Altiarchaeia archaeon]|jgi:ribose-phosphate pyrophosphokinase
MIVFSGSSCASLGRKIAKGKGLIPGKAKVERFPDGEIYLRLVSPVKGEECVLVQSTLGNDNLVELLLFLDMLRDQGASSVHAVVPYFGYARQDKSFNSGEALSAKTSLKLMLSLTDSVTTINCHFLDREGVYKFHDLEIKNLDAFPLLAKYFKEHLKCPMLIAPDKGSLEYAKNAAEIIGCEFDFLQKKRLSGEKVEIQTKDLDVQGKDTLILDDMISTGGTIIEAAKLLKSQGASSVNAGCVHGVFSTGAERVRSAVDLLVCTDTLERGISKVSVAQLIGKSLTQTTP